MYPPPARPAPSPAVEALRARFCSIYPEYRCLTVEIQQIRRTWYSYTNLLVEFGDPMFAENCVDDLAAYKQNDGQLRRKWVDLDGKMQKLIKKWKRLEKNGETMERCPYALDDWPWHAPEEEKRRGKVAGPDEAGRFTLVEANRRWLKVD